MKCTSIARWLLALPAFSLAFAAPAMAHRVVHVQGTLYVIVCEPDGSAFTFNGTSTGAGEIGGLLCPTAITGGGGSNPEAGWQVIEARPAQQALAIKTKGVPVQREAAPAAGHAAREAAHTVQQGSGK